LLGLSSKTTGVGRSFSYTAQATGTAPISFAFENLPPGLSASGATISGTPTEAGQYSVNVSASNPVGSTSGVLNIVVSPFDPSVGLTLSRAIVDLEDEESDLVTLAGTMSVTKGLAVRGKTFRVKIGDVEDTFTLSRTGAARRRGGFDFVTLTGRISRGKFTGNTIRFSVGLGDRDDLAEKLFELFPEDPTVFGSDYRVNLAVEIEFDGASLITTIPMKYNARSGRWTKG